MLLTWFGHHSFRIEYENKIIYLDPYAGLPEWYDTPANLVLISKNSYDHFSRAILGRIVVDGTHIFGTAEVSRELFGCRPFAPGESIIFEDNTKVQATAATVSRRNFTEHSLGWLLTIDGRTIYFAGDTNQVPNLAEAKVEIIVLPVGGITTMRAKEAAAIINSLKPKLAIPTHYGRTGTVDDALLFKELCSTEVRILEPGKEAAL